MYADDHSLMSDDDSRLVPLTATATGAGAGYANHPVTVVTRYHEPVYASSTTLDEKQRRYLCWNFVGTSLPL